MLETYQNFDAAYPWFFAAASFAFGAIVGSFLNVCIYRIPAGKSIVTPGSTCACGKPVAPYDNIPILSWLILRGKARCCGKAFSIRYPLVEAATGALFLLAWIEHPALKALCLMILVSMLVCASLIDLDTMEIPDRFSIGLAFAGIALSVAIPSLHAQEHSIFAYASSRAFIDSIVGLFVGSGIILWLALSAEIVLRKEAMGFGDVKLLGGIGAFLGWQGALFSLFGGAALGTVGLSIFMLVNALSKKSKSEKLMGRRAPFGPMLAAGALVYALFLEEEVDAYFAMIAEIL